MRACLFLASLLFVSVCSIPVSIPVSSKKVEKFVDDISKSLTIDHQNALKAVSLQNSTLLTKKRRLDGLTLEFNHLRRKLSNITETFNEYNRQRNSALNDYSTYMKHFQKIESSISKGKIEYEREIQFLKEIKRYINKVSRLNCKP